MTNPLCGVAIDCSKNVSLQKMLIFWSKYSSLYVQIFHGELQNSMSLDSFLSR